MRRVSLGWLARTVALAGCAALGLACSSNDSTSTKDMVGASGGVSSTPGASGSGGALAGASGSAFGGAGSPAAPGGASSGGAGGAPGDAGPGTGETFQVSGRFLYDRCGEKVVLRGVNEMIVWSDGRDGLPEFAEIAKTGANAVRIVWTEEGSAAELDAAIANAVQQQLIPMVEHHGATGMLGNVSSVVDYWTQGDVVAVIAKHQANVLLNIANEAGDDKVTQQAFEQTYQDAITRLRAAAIKVPLIIDAPSWGQDIDRLQASGPGLLAFDPLKRVMFSVHMWWHDPAGARIQAELAESVAAQLPLLVGEFAQHAVYQCENSPFDYATLLAQAQQHQIGWLAWSWGGVVNNDCKGTAPFDMTQGGVFGSWTGSWASDVAIDHPNSIQNTSKRPRSLVTGSCQ